VGTNRVSSSRGAIELRDDQSGGSGGPDDANITFSNLPPGSLVAAAVYDALTTGHMLMYGTLTTPREIAEGDSLFVSVGDLTHIFG
jgi:hypothetical protein